MIGMNTGNSSAAETPFGGIKESGYGKESGIGVGKSWRRPVVLLTATVLTLASDQRVHDLQDWYFDLGGPLLDDARVEIYEFYVRSNFDRAFPSCAGFKTPMLVPSSPTRAGLSGCKVCRR